MLTSRSPGDATTTATNTGMVGRQRVTARAREVSPSVTGRLNVRTSPEYLFLYRAEMEANFRETGGGRAT